MNSYTPYGPKLVCHQLPCKYYTRPRDLGNKMSHSSGRRGTDGQKSTYEGGRWSQCLKVLPNEDLILTHYMILLWWIKLLEGLRHYVILNGAIEQVMVMTTNLMNMGYIYTRLRLMKPPDIFFTLDHFRWLIAWNPSRLTHDLALRGRDQSLKYTSPTKAFIGTENHNLHIYMVHTLGFRVHTLHPSLLQNMYRVYTYRSRGRNSSQWHCRDHQIKGDRHHHPGPRI